jgi:hypothetical protein
MHFRVFEHSAMLTLTHVLSSDQTGHFASTGCAEPKLKSLTWWQKALSSFDEPQTSKNFDRRIRHSNLRQR